MKKVSFVLILTFLISFVTFSHVTVYGQPLSQEIPAAYTNTILEGNYDEQWYQNDRKHFATLLSTIKTPETKNILYEEYLTLIKEREKLENSAYHSERGYTIYSPEITKKLNTLQFAVQSRSLLLRDIMLNKVKNLDFYYNSNYQYVVTGVSESTFAQIVPEQNGFDINKVINAINSLPIPNGFLYGQKIWYINGYPKGKSEAGINIPGVLGNFDGNIVVYNFNIPGIYNNMVGTTLHEIGHNVGRAIFSPNPQDPDILDNQQAVKQYASIYNKQIYNDKGSWENKVSENFSEDFAYIFGGFTKNPFVWKGGNAAKVRSFIKNYITKVDLSESYFSGYKLVTSDGAFSHFYSPYNFQKAETFVTSDDEVSVSLEGINIASKSPMVIVSPVADNISDDDIFVGETEGNNCFITFPRDGVYKVDIWLDGEYISRGFTFYVVKL